MNAGHDYGLATKLADGLVRHRILVALVALAITAVAAVGAGRVGFDSDIEIWFLDNDPNLLKYKQFLERFEADEIAIIGIFADDVFKPEILAAIEKMGEEAGDLEQTYKVRSLANVKIARSRGPLNVRIERLVGDDGVPKDPELAADLRKETLAHPLLVGNLVAKDGKATAVVVELDAQHNNFEAKFAFVTALEKIAEKHMPRGVKWHVAGSPALDKAFMEYTERDFRVLGPASAFLVLLLMLALFRRIFVAMVPLVVVGLSNLWLFGFMGWAGLKIDIVSSGLMAVILAVGVADSVHVLSDYYQQIAAGLKRREAVVDATASLFVPCLFTSMTTAVGFLSLLTSDLKPIRQYGYLAALGVVIAFVLSMTLIPILLSWLPAPDASFIKRLREGRTTRLLGWMGRPSMRRARITLAISAAIVLGAVAMLPRLYTDANPMNYFLPGDPVREAMTAVDQGLGGSTSMEFLIETPDGGLKEPKTLQRLDDLAERMEKMAAVTTVISFLDSLKEVHGELLGDDAKKILPDTRPLAAQLYLTLEGDSDFTSSVQGDYSVGRMTARVEMSRAHELTKAWPAFEDYITANYSGDDLRVTPTGFIKLMGDMEHYLFRSQVRSLLSAFIAITLMMFILLRSLRLGAFSMIPNLVPILLGLAFMATVAIPLDPGTIMIGSIALGLVVDDTVHFLVRLRRNVDRHELEDAIDETMKQTGRPIVVTSVALGAGFAVMGLGSFSPNVAFGVVSSFVVILAMVADLVMLPAALLVVRPNVTVRNKA